jgi:hypothetical protein
LFVCHRDTEGTERAPNVLDELTVIQYRQERRKVVGRQDRVRHELHQLSPVSKRCGYWDFYKKRNGALRTPRL